MTCQAIQERKALTLAIADAIQPYGIKDREVRIAELLEPLHRDGIFGEEKGLAVMFSVLHGIVGEYLDGGDQMVENCSCGLHTHRDTNR